MSKYDVFHPDIRRQLEYMDNQIGLMNPRDIESGRVDGLRLQDSISLARIARALDHIAFKARSGP